MLAESELGRKIANSAIGRITDRLSLKNSVARSQTLPMLTTIGPIAPRRVPRYPSARTLPLAQGRRICQCLRGARDWRNRLQVTDIFNEIEWRVAAAPVPYDLALAEMEARAANIARGAARELVWLLEHPPVYTAGTSADVAELIDPRFPVIAAGRGGRYTYHGPGQRIGYLVIDLNKRGRDVRCFVHALEGWVIDALGEIDIAAFRAQGRIGIWAHDDHGAEAKIGAIGVRVKRWVTMHGFSVNLSPDLTHFDGIVPCGIADFGVTSAEALGKATDFATFDAALALHCNAFGKRLSCGAENGA